MPRLRQISHRAGGTVRLYQGGRLLRPATGEERRTLPVMPVWGRQVIQLLAEKHFVRLLTAAKSWAGEPTA